MTLSPKRVDIDFPGKDKDEKTFLVIRRHWVFYAKNLFVQLSIFVLPFAGFLLVIKLLPNLLDFPYSPLLILGASLYYLFAATAAMISFTNYYFDAWIVTDKRIVAIEQRSIFDHVVSELQLHNVQDITIENKGVLAVFFKYGTIFVQTAGTKTRFTFEAVPQIKEVKEEINDLVHKATRREQIEIHELEQKENHAPR